MKAADRAAFFLEKLLLLSQFCESGLMIFTS